ncbi:protein kinase domain-containing protein [Streptomyces sp. SAJ15]|uniref:serine/threonine-protein kinase n=1 Tax=Streptomyces sp. SAJ15 TaxID=2011095 RepID=UPI001185C7EA|nr:serine/threonine-protein kinase [Streptomyces sp. SAJ15]TVL92100.1 serine/threonine protein kinase [Streptomyces sp. SAJ15]
MPLSAGDPESIGDYQLLERLGSGGMGVVYRACSASGRQVAVKLVHAQFALDDEFRTRFRQEVAAARRVSGAYTAPVVDADPDAERPWMATLYVPGQTLAQRLADTGPLDAAELRRLALGMAEALGDIHRVGVVHRDLKPANVLMSEDGPRVIDFGISRAADNQTLTVTGRVMGTPPFMSPEQLSRPREVTAASDIFSLGALLVYAVTGRGPFDSDSPYMTAYQVVHEPPALEELARPLRDIVADCLAKDPAERPALPELMARLRDLPTRGSLLAQAGETGADAPAGRPEAGSGTASARDSGPDRPPRDYGPTSPGRRRRRTVLAIVAAVAALGLGGGGVALYASGGSGVRTSSDPGPSETATPSTRAVPLPAGWRPWRMSQPVAAGVDHVQGDESDPGCVAQGTTLYCGGMDAPVVRINGLNGEVEWRARGLVLNVDTTSTNTSPLNVHGDLVYLHDAVNDTTSRLVALRTDTGTAAWSHQVSSTADTQLVGDLLLSNTPGDGAIVARHAVTGQTRWTAPLPKGASCNPMPSTSGPPYAYCWLSENRSTMMRFDPRDGTMKQLGRLRDTDEPLGRRNGALLALRADASTFARYEKLIRIDEKTGKERSFRLPAGASGTGALVDGRLFFVQESGRVTLVDPDTGAEVWSRATPVERLGKPLVSKDGRTIYLCSSSGRFQAIRMSDGRPLWQSAARSSTSGFGPTSEVLPLGGALVGTAVDGTVFSIDPEHPNAKPRP